MATTTNFGWETPDDTDLVKDGALAMRTLGNSIDTSFVDLKGGTTGQVLSKASNTDLDFTWVAQDDSNAIQNAIIDAKGDLIVGTAADTPARLAVGTNGHVLTADSAEASGMKWAAASGGLTYTNIATSSSSPLPDVTNGNATIIHRYAQSGKFVHQFLQFTWGSTTTISSGASLLTLSPAVTAASGYSIFAVGTVLFYDASANHVFLGRARMDGQAIYLYCEDDLGSYSRAVNTTNTVPMTWATDDRITVNVFYEAA